MPGVKTWSFAGLIFGVEGAFCARIVCSILTLPITYFFLRMLLDIGNKELLILATVSTAFSLLMVSLNNYS